ncbi:MAG: alkaline phosphatase family protein [Bacteroidota bacterium]
MPDSTALRRIAKKVLLIGWDAADWKVITPLLDAGKMPALERLINRGVMGNLATLDPPFSPMLWTSVATGKTADQHGILGFVEPTPDGRAIRPVMGASRTCKALWNILHQNGLRSNVVGWWPSHPAEPINGAMVSNFYQRATQRIDQAQVLPKGTVHPPELAEVFTQLRIHPEELTAAHLLPFVPKAAEIDPEEDRRLTTLSRIIADAASIQAAATYLLEHTEWDLTAVYFDAIDHFGHGFMKFHPPQLPGLPDDLFERYKGVIEASYRFHDMLLDRLLDFADDDTAVLLISDHGFHSDHLRPRTIPKVPAGPAVEHRAFGIIAMAGPEIKQDDRVYGAGLLDIAPTVLTLFGLPFGEDMKGMPLVGAFEDPPPFHTIPSWEDVEGDDGQFDAALRVDTWGEQEALRQLVELGYIEPGETNQERRVDQAVYESKYYLARVYLSTGRAPLAVPLLEEAYAANTEGVTAERRRFFGIWLLGAYQAANQLEQARSLLDELGEDESATPSALLEVARVQLLMHDGHAAKALERLEALATNRGHTSDSLLLLGRLYMRAKRYEDAAISFERVAAYDPDNARAYDGLARARFEQGRYEDAIRDALAAVARLYHLPGAHYTLGAAFTKLGMMDRAEEAFLVCAQQSPGNPLPHRWLSRIYRDYLRDRKAARHHAALAGEMQRTLANRSTSVKT